MRYRSDQLPILYHRRSGHTLDDAAGTLQKPAVRDMYHKIFIAALSPVINLPDFNLIFFHLPVHTAQDGCRACRHLLLKADLHLPVSKFFFSPFIQAAADPVVLVDADTAKLLLIPISNHPL